ncbi:MAG: hypothetical protein J5586_05450 [Clostridia bacterium]|nr:hypothetical protein [Clostridia bacterium]
MRFSELNLGRKLLYGFLVLLISPVIAVGLVCFGVYLLIEKLKEPRYRREYEASAYGRELGIPFEPHIRYSEGYKLYNSARERGLELRLERGADAHDAVLYGGAVYLLPWFETLVYDEAAQVWHIDDGEDDPELGAGFGEELRSVGTRHPGMPVYLLVSDDMLCTADDPENEEGRGPEYFGALLPEYVLRGSSCLAAMTREEGL